MDMDGKILAQARAEKEDIRRRREAEDARRRELVYGRVPALRQLDGQLAALIGELAAAALGGGMSVDELRRQALELQSRRAELLVENGWPSDWLDGAWDCPKCRDTGYVDGRMCQCLQELYEKHRAVGLSALLKLGDERFEDFDLRYYDARPDPETGRAPRQQMERVYRICRNYAEKFGKSSDNLLLWGGPGLGKTFLSACIARAVSERGRSVVYETVVSAMAAFETQKFHPSAEADDRVGRLLGCELLILDDLGTEMVTDFSKSALYTLVNTRLLRGNKTIISTNLTEEGLRRLYTPQLCSRLLGEYQDLPFVGTDIRQLKKERGL